MWFRQAQLFQLEGKAFLNAEKLEEQLEQLPFSSCPSGLPLTQGWVPPADEEDDSLVYTVPGFLLLCLQTEAKLIPPKIIRQKLNERIKEIQLIQNRTISYQEKNILKQEVYSELLPQAFGVLYRDYAFIDTKNNWLILNTNSKKNTEKFIMFFKRSLSKIKITSPELKNLSPILTRWVDNLPKTLTIENACVLQDPRQAERTIRIQQQDLSANYVQTLLKNNFEISQIKITWADQITCVLKHDFTFQSLQYHDSVTEVPDTDKRKTEEDNFRTDFFIMSGTLTKMFQDLLKIFKR